MAVDGPPILPGVTDPRSSATPPEGPLSLLAAMLDGGAPSQDARRPAGNKIKDAIALLREAASEDERLGERVQDAIAKLQGRDTDSIRQRGNSRAPKVGRLFGGADVSTPI